MKNNNLEKEEKEKLKKWGETQGRVFITSLKTDKEGNSWTDQERITELLKKTNGSIEIYTITHMQENENKKHQHFVIVYKTPRKIKNVANMFNVEYNFIDKAISKKAQLRYLIHADNQEKEQYTPEEVTTNSTKPYWAEIVKNEMSDSEILEYINKNGIRALTKLVGIIEINKLNAIIKFYKEIKKIS